MAQESKSRLDKQTLSRSFETFAQFFALISKRGKTKLVLDEFLTPTEKLYLSKRLMVAYFLTKSIDYDTISNVLKVSRSTITGVSRRIASEDSQFLKELDNFFTREIWKENLGSLLDSLVYKYPGASQRRQHALEHR